MELGKKAEFTPHYDVIQGREREQELEALLNLCFKVPEGASFFEDFPVWSERHGAAFFRVGAYDRERLVSSSLIRIAKLKSPRGPTTVAILGGVATHPDYKGQGLASQATELAIEWARAKGCAAVFLWGSEIQLYQRLGFDLCGEQYRVPLAGVEGLSDVVVTRPVQKGWNFSIVKLLLAREGGLQILPADASWFSSHPNVTWYWVGDPQRPRAYAAIGRGIDLQGIVHEWGGDRDALLEVLAQVLKENPEAQIIGSQDLLNRQGFVYQSAFVEYLCMAKILDAQKFHLREGLHAFTPRDLFGPPEGVFPLWFWGLDGA